MRNKLLSTLKKRLASDRSVRFAYLFGSQARKDAGKLSDIDIAVFLQSNVDYFHYRLVLIERFEKALGVPKVDVIVLNSSPPVLSHEVVKTGIIIKESKEERVGFELESIRQYLDTEHLRNTQLSYLRQHLKAGTFFG